MKKVLIITSRSEKTVAWKERERYVREFCENVTEMLEDITVTYTTYRDLRYLVVNGEQSIYDTLNAADVKTFDLVHFKNWQYDTGEAPVVAAYLQRHDVSFYNSETHIPLAPGKLAQMFHLSANGIPVPDTLYASKEQLRAYFQDGNLPEPFTYPLIMKANDGSKGDDNYLIHHAKEALDVLSASDPEKEYVLQNFIPNDGDYRLLYIGLDSGDEPLIFRRQAVAGSHLNNTSKGGTGTFLEPKDFPAEYKQYARKAAELLGREIGGVDILVDKTNAKPYVLEVNGTPALATGHGVDTKAKRFADFLRQTLEAAEEE